MIANDPLTVIFHCDFPHRPLQSDPTDRLATSKGMNRDAAARRASDMRATAAPYQTVAYPSTRIGGRANKVRSRADRLAVPFLNRFRDSMNDQITSFHAARVNGRSWTGNGRVLRCQLGEGQRLGPACPISIGPPRHAHRPRSRLPCHQSP